MIKLLARAFAALRSIASQDQERAPLDHICIRPKGEDRTSMVAIDGTILIEATFPGRETDFDVLAPRETADRLARAGEEWIGLVARPGAAEAEAWAGDETIKWPLRAFERAYPDFVVHIDNALTGPESRERARITFDLAVLGRLVDALRKLNPTRARHGKEGAKVLLHLYLLREDLGVAFRVEDKLGEEGMAVRGMVMPVAIHPQKAPDAVRALNLRRQQRAPKTESVDIDKKG